MSISSRTSIAVVAAVLASCLAARTISAQGGGQQGPPPAPQGPFAPEKYKNIQTLKGLPAAELDGVMRFMAASLGVNCEFCHVRTGSTWEYDKDDKDAKKTARTMIAMMNTINAQSFEGRVTVNCASCHHGLQEPNRIPPLAEPLTPEQVAAAAQRAQFQAAQARAGGPGAGGPPAGGPPAGGPPAGGPPAGAPAAAGAPGVQGRGPGGPGGGRGGPPRPTETVDQVLDKYFAAVGGRDAVAKLSSRVMRGTVTDRAGRTANFSVEEKPGKVRQTTEMPNGQVVRAFDGASAWVQNQSGVEDVEAAIPQQQIARGADLGLAAQMKDKYQNLGATRYGKIDDKDVIILSGRPVPTVTEQFYFDRNSGLLLRRTVSTRTAFGQLPEQFDYSDYRDVNGVKVPFQVRYATWNNVSTEKFTDVKLNAPVDDARFTKPR